MIQPIDVVNAYRAATGKRVEYAKAEHSARRFITWCNTNDVDALLFLKARVYLAKEGARDIPGIGQLASKALLEEDAWIEILDRAEAIETDASFVRSELEKHEARRIAGLIALTPAQEKFQMHQRSPRVCMNDSHFSGGYHQKSKQCAVCPIGGECAELLNKTHGFDVVLLRSKYGHIGYAKIE